MLTERQNKIFKMIVENHIKTAQPISSEYLSKKLNLSSATIRNEMAELIMQGFLDQPHTSAGRIPSENGWFYYVENFVTENPSLYPKDKKELEGLVFGGDAREFSKNLAKKIVELADAAVMVAYSPRDIYYTGLTNLFSQPEFQELGAIVKLSQVIDHLDEAMLGLFDEVDGRVIRIGEQNPFSPQCSLLIANFGQSQGKGVFGILGPQRMNYSNNKALLNYAINALN